MATWFAPHITPPVPARSERAFLVCVERASGNRYVFEALFLNEYPLNFDDGCQHGDELADGSHSEGCPISGWFATPGDEQPYEALYLGEGDRFIAWRLPPDPPVDAEIVTEARS